MFREACGIMESGFFWNDAQIQRLSSELLSLVLLKTLLLNASASDSNHVYTVYVTLTSVSRDWRRMIIGQPWFHATPTEPALTLIPDYDGKYNFCFFS